MAKTVFSAKEKSNARKKALSDIMTEEGNLSTCIKKVKSYASSLDSVKDFLKKSNVTVAELSKITPAELVKVWTCQDYNGNALKAKRTYKNELDKDGNKVLDYVEFVTVSKWTVGNVLRMLQDLHNEKVRINKHETGCKYDIVNGQYVRREETTETETK